MGDDLRKVQSGDKLRITASAYNAFVEAAREMQNRRLRMTQDSQPQPRNTTIILVKNSSGADRAQFEVLGIAGPLFPPTGTGSNLQEFKNKVVLDCTTPTTALHSGKFVVLAEPIKAGMIGRAFVAGVFPAKVEIAAAGDSYADVKASAAELKTGSYGAAQILWKESGTGTGKWALVQYPAASAGPVLIKFTGNRDRYGTYAGQIVTPLSTSFDDTTEETFDDSDIGTAGREVTVVNLNERGQEGHGLTQGTPDCHMWYCHPTGRIDEGSGFELFYVNAVDVGCPT